MPPLFVSRILLLACVGCQLLATVGLAQESAIIEGHAFNKLTGVPVEFAWVELAGHANIVPSVPRTLDRTATDQNGFFSVEVLASDFDFDLYILSVECDVRVRRDDSVRTVVGHSILESVRPGVMRRDLYLPAARFPRRIVCAGPPLSSSPLPIEPLP